MKSIEFERHLYECHSEGRVSQMFYLDPSFYSMQSRKKVLKTKIKRLKLKKRDSFPSRRIL